MVAAGYLPRVSASCKLTEDGEGPCDRLKAGRVAGVTHVVPGITATDRADDQRATGDDDSRVGGDGYASFAPLDRDLRPGGPRATQRRIFILHCRRSKQGHPNYCIYKENIKIKTFFLPKSCKHRENVS